jgi:hypothetical protein
MVGPQKNPKRKQPHAPQRDFTPALNELFERYTTAKTPGEEHSLRIDFLMEVLKEVMSSAGLDHRKISIEQLGMAPEFDMATNYDAAIAQEIAKGLVFYRARTTEIEASEGPASLQMVLNAGAELGRTEYFALVGYMRALQPRALVTYNAKKGYTKLAERAQKQIAWVPVAMLGYAAYSCLLGREAELTNTLKDQWAITAGDAFAKREGYSPSRRMLKKYVEAQPHLVSEAVIRVKSAMAETCEDGLVYRALHFAKNRSAGWPLAT